MDFWRAECTERCPFGSGRCGWPINVRRPAEPSDELLQVRVLSRLFLRKTPEISQESSFVQ